MKKTLCLVMLAFSAAGCASYDISEEGGRSMISIHNSGWELLSCIPIASGDPDNPNGFGCRWLRNTVTVENNLKILNRVMEEKGADDIRNLSSSIVDETVFFILVNRHVYHTSAELVYGSVIPERPPLTGK